MKFMRQRGGLNSPRRINAQEIRLSMKFHVDKRTIDEDDSNILQVSNFADFEKQVGTLTAEAANLRYAIGEHRSDMTRELPN